MRLPRSAGLLLGAVLALGCRPGASRADTPKFARADGLQAVVAADGFEQPVFLCAAPGDARLFVVEQPGRIRWIEAGRPSKDVFLDLTGHGLR